MEETDEAGEMWFGSCAWQISDKVKFEGTRKRLFPAAELVEHAFDHA
jgi:hypothetical protein